MRQTLKIGIALVVVAALAMSGIALAQTGSDSTTSTTTVQDSPRYTHLQDVLAPLVDDQTLTQTQADAVAELLAQELPMRGRPGLRFRAFEEVADFFDMTPLELRTALQDYDTLADFAAANGSGADELISYLVDKVLAHVDDAVANGRITEDQATDIVANATQHITDMVNGAIPEPPAGGFGGGPRPPGPGGGPAQGDGQGNGQGGNA
jgi:hypothetical protein